MARSLLTAALIALSITFFEAFFRRPLLQKPFIMLVLARSLAYTTIVILWLILVNGFWQIIASSTNLWQGISIYVNDPAFAINFVTVFLII